MLHRVSALSQALISRPTRTARTCVRWPGLSRRLEQSTARTSDTGVRQASALRTRRRGLVPGLMLGPVGGPPSTAYWVRRKTPTGARALYRPVEPSRSLAEGITLPRASEGLLRPLRGSWRHWRDFSRQRLGAYGRWGPSCCRASDTGGRGSASATLDHGGLPRPPPSPPAFSLYSVRSTSKPHRMPLCQEGDASRSLQKGHRGVFESS